MPVEKTDVESAALSMPHESRFRNTPLKIALGFATIYLVWGSTYLAIRLGVETIPAFMLAGVRFVIGGGLMYLWARFSSGARLRDLKPIHWRSAAIVGLLLVVGGNGLVTLAEETVPSGLASLLVAMVPLWIVLAEWISPRGECPRRGVIAGLLIGFVGVTALINPTNIGGFAEINYMGAFTIVVATILWAAGSVYSRYATQPESHNLAVGLQIFIGGIALLLLSFIRGEYQTFDIAQVSAVSIWSLVYLTTIGIFAYAVYMWLLRASTPSKVATYAYVNPVIALALGSIVANETLSGWTLGCSAVILIGVYMIIQSKARTAAESQSESSAIQKIVLEKRSALIGAPLSSEAEECG